MKVIVAGLPKTGTKSMVAALRQLGYTVYDYMEHYEFHAADWLQVVGRGATGRADWRRMYEGVDAVADVPACFFWEQILDAFPDAKIIFTTRDSEDVWWESMRMHFRSSFPRILHLLHLFSPTFRHFMNYTDLTVTAVFGSRIHRPYFSDSHVNEALCRMTYRRHNNYLLQNAPKDRLLVYNVQQGWEPLCRFLALPQPDGEFPHANRQSKWVEETTASHPLLIRMQREMLLASGTLALLSLVLACRARGVAVARLWRAPLGVVCGWACRVRASLG